MTPSAAIHLAVLATAATLAASQPPPRPSVVRAYLGSTPTLDGVLSPGEWADAEERDGLYDWSPAFTPVTSALDLDATLWVKHDRERLFLALRVHDNLLYWFNTSRFMPPLNADADALTPRGWPWWGDEAEWLLNAGLPRTWNGTSVGNGSSWQMVTNLHKSRLGGLGVGGLMEGEPRSSPVAWATYQKWIMDGAQQAAVGVTAGEGGRGDVWVVEWAARFDPCVELSPGVFYDASLPATRVGMNVALGDVDLLGDAGPPPLAGYGIRHEMWLSGRLGAHTQLDNFADLWLLPGRCDHCLAAGG